MQENGTKFIERSIPTVIEKLQDEKLRVKWKCLENEEIHEDIFDTILFAIGMKSLPVKNRCWKVLFCYFAYLHVNMDDLWMLMYTQT